jgi:hypothetical protein
MSIWRASSVMHAQMDQPGDDPNPMEINDENLSLALQLCGWDSEDGGNARQTAAKIVQIRLQPA